MPYVQPPIHKAAVPSAKEDCKSEPSVSTSLSPTHTNNSPQLLPLQHLLPIRRQQTSRLLFSSPRKLQRLPLRRQRLPIDLAIHRTRRDNNLGNLASRNPVRRGRGRKLQPNDHSRAAGRILHHDYRAGRQLAHDREREVRDCAGCRGGREQVEGEGDGGGRCGWTADFGRVGCFEAVVRV
jgi:hypothetical protein